MDLDLEATYRVVLVAKTDVFYNDRATCIGKDIQITQHLRDYPGNWIACTFKYVDTGQKSCFFKVLLKKLDQRPQIEDKTYTRR